MLRLCLLCYVCSQCVCFAVSAHTVFALLCMLTLFLLALCLYALQIESKAPDDDDNLACISTWHLDRAEVWHKTYHNPLLCGSATYLMNQAHCPRDNVKAVYRVLHGVVTNVSVQYTRITCAAWYTHAHT